MMKQISLVGSVGKTVQGVAGDCSNVLVTFTDGTFVHLGVEPGYEGDPGSVEDIKYSLTDSDVSTEAAVKIGLYSRDELVKMLAENEARQQAQFQQHELAMYLRLKAKFEKSQSDER